MGAYREFFLHELRFVRGRNSPMERKILKILPSDSTRKPMTQQEQYLQAFFVRYGETLAAGDLRTIANCYVLPGLVLSDMRSMAIADHEEIQTAFRGAAEAYRAQRLVAARPTIVSYEAIPERLVSVDVLWDYLDEQGRSAQ